MDIPYILNYFILLILAYLYWKKPNPRLVKWAFIIEFVFIALRAPVVGADTWNYVRYLDGERTFYNYDSRELESAFLLYRHVLSSLHPSRLVVMLVNSVLTCCPLYLMVKKYSLNVPFSMAMLPFFGFYNLYFVGLRQVLGLAILFMAILWVLDDGKRKWWVYAGCTYLGYLFHTTIIIYSVIFLIAYFLKFKSRKVLIVSIIISAFMGIVLQSFDVMAFFNYYLSLQVDATDRIAGYMQDNQNVNEITSIFMSLRPSIIAVFIYSLMDKDKLNHWFSVVYAIGVIIGNLFISVPMTHRLTGGLLIFGVIVITWMFSGRYHVSVRYRKIVNIALAFFLLYFSQMYVKNNMWSNIDLTGVGRMHPYQFVWEDYSNHPSIKYFN